MFTPCRHRGRGVGRRVMPAIRNNFPPQIRSASDANCFREILSSRSSCEETHNGAQKMQEPGRPANHVHERAAKEAPRGGNTRRGGQPASSTSDTNIATGPRRGEEHLRKQRPSRDHSTALLLKEAPCSNGGADKRCRSMETLNWPQLLRQLQQCVRRQRHKCSEPWKPGLVLIAV